jgi:hypothetical protein
MKTYYILDRVRCRWVQVTTDLATWAKLPHVKAGVCTLGGAAIIGGGIALLPPGPRHDPITPAIDEPGPAITPGSPLGGVYPAIYSPEWDTWGRLPASPHEDHEHHHRHDENNPPVNDIDEPPSWVVLIPAVMGLIVLLWQEKRNRASKKRVL